MPCPIKEMTFMPRIDKSIAQGFGKGYLETLLDAILTDMTAQKVIIDELVDDHATLKTQLDDISDKYAAHRHSVAGAASTGTAPSTVAATAEATASTIAKTLAGLTATKTDLTTTT